MCSEYLQKYDDFIKANERLAHLKPDESIEEIFNLITSVLIDKYKMAFKELILVILIAIRFNYRSIKSYIKILNQIITKYSLDYSEFCYKKYIWAQQEYLSIDYEKDRPNQIDFDRDEFPQEDEVLYMIMYDQVDKFKEYVSKNSFHDQRLKIPGFSWFTPLEACCYFGAVNIFFFIKSISDCNISEKCLLLALVGVILILSMNA